MPTGYPKSPRTIGEHLRKKRMDLGLFQCDLAKILGVTEDCITYWENDRCEPQINYFPKIHLFLGYLPFCFGDETFAGRLKYFRWRNGLSYKRLGKIVGSDPSSLKKWEIGKILPPKRKMEELETLFLDKSMVL